MYKYHRGIRVDMENIKHFKSVEFFAVFYNIILEIAQKGDSSFLGNWWELYVQVEPLYIGQMAVCLVHAVTGIFIVNNTLWK